MEERDFALRPARDSFGGLSPFASIDWRAFVNS